jgi:ubiquitin C-terminal hydrolase
MEEIFIQELYNLSLEDLDEILNGDTSNIFKNTYNELMKKDIDELNKIIQELEQKEEKGEEKNEEEGENISEKDEEDENEEEKEEEKGEEKDEEDEKEEPTEKNITDSATDQVKTSVVESSVENKAKEVVIPDETPPGIEVNLSIQEIETKIQNAAIDAIRYQIELEKEKSYALEYPRKQVGIINPNNTCYANSAVQMIYSLPFYRKYYTEINLSSPNELLYDFTYDDKGSAVKKYLKFQKITQQSTEEQKIEKKIEKHLEILQKIFIQFKDASSNSITIEGGNCPVIINDDKLNTSIMSQIRNTGIPEQQDVNDYLTDFRKIYIYNDVNFFEEIKFSICADGSKIQLQMDPPSPILHLQIPKIENNTIEKCLEKYLLEDIAESEQTYKSCQDGKRIKLLTQFKMSEMNRYFFIHLVRFDIEMKNGKFVRGDKKLDVVKPNKTLILGGIKYTLSGIISHIGDELEIGHYIYYQCDEKGDFIMKYNDDIVTLFDMQETKSINENGYMFAYTRYPVSENNPDV